MDSLTDRPFSTGVSCTSHSIYAWDYFKSMICLFFSLLKRYPTSPSRWSVSQGSYQGEDYLENPLAKPGPASSLRRELPFGMFKIRSFSSQYFYSSWQSQPGHFYGSISVSEHLSSFGVGAGPA